MASGEGQKNGEAMDLEKFQCLETSNRKSGKRLGKKKAFGDAPWRESVLQGPRERLWEWELVGKRKSCLRVGAAHCCKNAKTVIWCK